MSRWDVMGLFTCPSAHCVFSRYRCEVPRHDLFHARGGRSAGSQAFAGNAHSTRMIPLSSLPALSSRMSWNLPERESRDHWKFSEVPPGTSTTAKEGQSSGCFLICRSMRRSWRNLKDSCSELKMPRRTEFEILILLRIIPALVKLPDPDRFWAALAGPRLVIFPGG